MDVLNNVLMYTWFVQEKDKHIIMEKKGYNCLTSGPLQNAN